MAKAQQPTFDAEKKELALAGDLEKGKVARFGRQTADIAIGEKVVAKQGKDEAFELERKPKVNASDNEQGVLTFTPKPGFKVLRAQIGWDGTTPYVEADLRKE
jgi:hypothetical protein